MEREGRGRLKLNDVQTGDQLKVANVGGSHSVAEFERTGPDQQIRERDAHSLRLALAVNLAGAEGDWDRYRLDGNASEQLFKKALPALTAFGGIGACDAVSKLQHGDDGIPSSPVSSATASRSWRAFLPWRSAATAAVESSISPKRAAPAAPDGR